MINAELTHNPYLLQTSVKFNGHAPRINSQIEKYEDKTLTDWVEKIPGIFYDEMNGYDFDLHFIGTKSDFEEVRNTFLQAGISEEMVRLFHKNELEDAETKSREIAALYWLFRSVRDLSVFFWYGIQDGISTDRTCCSCLGW